VDQEYNRFRNKFIRALTVINNNGSLSQVDPTVYPSTWVAAALANITRDKSLSFPFALNTIGGGQYFIPATPAALGVLAAVIPAMVVDYTYATPILMIQGHDGSLTPAFNDWRDDVLLALETQIYQNLPAQFQTDARPVFDIYQWIGNAFGTPLNGYTYFEFTAIMAPLFQYWAQSNQLDYRTNVGYDANNCLATGARYTIFTTERMRRIPDHGRCLASSVSRPGGLALMAALRTPPPTRRCGRTWRMATSRRACALASIHCTRVLGCPICCR
jgi:hypothetical protein